MRLRAGTRLGAYEIVSILGTGGMGEVYRAHDSRLDRDVALKILSAETALDSDREARFEQEARAAAALNHPNIVSVHDIGRQNGLSYIVSELVPGDSLRAILARGRMDLENALSVASQIAEALAVAHAAGIVHRDLKPENIMRTPGGRAKILDFGLAKYTPRVAKGSDTVTVALNTGPGTVMGTVGYMSPEQVRGQAVDHRSDIFSLGLIIYEMLSGKRAFSGPSSADVLSAILNENPEPLDSQIPEHVRRIVNRCLNKESALRFQSAADLAFVLQAPTVSDNVPKSNALARKRVPWRAAAIVLVVGALCAAGAVWWTRPKPSQPLRFEQLTFRAGNRIRARFLPDGSGYAYTAVWSGEPQATFIARPGEREPRPLPMPRDAELQAISAAGDLAILIGRKSLQGEGLLARTAPGGGPERDIAENVVCADWRLDGSAMALIRRSGRTRSIEYPIGRKLYEGRDFDPYFLRISPDGKMVAVSGLQVGSSFRGEVRVYDEPGKYMVIYQSPVGSVVRPSPLVWKPDGSEVWFGSLEARHLGTILAANLKRKVRTAIDLPEVAALHDIDRNGRILLTLGSWRTDLVVTDDSGQRELRWFGFSTFPRLTRDGKNIIFTEEGQQNFAREIYSRPVQGGPAVKLSDGSPMAIAPSGRYVIAWRPTADPAYVVVPTGPGNEITLRTPGWNFGPGAPMAFLPGEHAIIARATQDGHTLSRLITYDFLSGSIHPFTPEMNLGSRLFMAADGSAAYAEVNEGWERLPLNGAPHGPVKGLEMGEAIIGVAGDGSHVYIGTAARSHLQVSRLDAATGNRSPVQDVPYTSDAATVLSPSDCAISADGRTVVYSRSQSRATLYLVTGL